MTASGTGRIDNDAIPTNIEVWNELQNIKVKLIEIDSKLDDFIIGIENIRQGFLEAVEEFEMSLKEDNNG